LLTGFNSVHYFSKYFKEKVKLTPSEFKELALSNLMVDFYDVNDQDPHYKRIKPEFS